MSQSQDCIFKTDNFDIMQKNELVYYSVMSPASAVGVVTDYRLDGRAVGVQVPIGARIFSSPRCPDQFWGPPNLLFSG
jgi:hypothetical protein